jgi:hypothetical protein
MLWHYTSIISYSSHRERIFFLVKEKKKKDCSEFDLCKENSATAAFYHENYPSKSFLGSWVLIYVDTIEQLPVTDAAFSFWRFCE